VLGGEGSEWFSRGFLGDLKNLAWLKNGRGGYLINRFKSVDGAEVGSIDGLAGRSLQRKAGAEEASEHTLSKDKGREEASSCQGLRGRG